MAQEEVAAWSFHLKDQIDRMRKYYLNLTFLKGSEYERSKDEMMRVKAWIDDAVTRVSFMDGVVKMRRESGTLRDRIESAVGQVFGVSIEDIQNPCRKRHLMMARTMYCYLFRTLTAYSLTYIGSILNRDHTTIIHGLNRFQDLYHTDPDFRDDARRVMGILKDGGISVMGDWMERLDKGVIQTRKFE